MPVQAYDPFSEQRKPLELPSEEHDLFNDPVPLEPQPLPDEQALEGDPERELDAQKRRGEVARQRIETTLPPLSDDREERLAVLFDTLKTNRNDALSKKAAAEIQKTWATSGDDTITLLMRWANEAVQGGKLGVALDYLDNVTRLDPTYVEGWNRRATVHYLRDDYARSIADVEQTLSLEPRHFGAISGLGMMMRSLGREEEALALLRQSLALNPVQDNVRSTLEDLERQVGDRDI